MKKVILIIVALVMVASGVAAVSAYEAHTVNVKAHVENALGITWSDTSADFEFGTMFPEEWDGNHFQVGLSESAITEITAGRVTSVDAQIYAEWKEGPAAMESYFWDSTVPGYVTTTGYYNWIGDCLYVKDGAMPTPVNGTDLPVGPATAGPPSAQPYLAAYNFNSVSSRTFYVYIDAPVFAGFYNPVTDALACPSGKPSGMDHPTWIIPEFGPDGTTVNPLHNPAGIDLGIDLKIQVTGINRP